MSGLPSSSRARPRWTPQSSAMSCQNEESPQRRRSQEEEEEENEEEKEKEEQEKEQEREKEEEEEGKGGGVGEGRRDEGNGGVTGDEVHLLTTSEPMCCSVHTDPEALWRGPVEGGALRTSTSTST